MPPSVIPTVEGEKPERCRNVGIHAEIPPSENVTAAIPSVAYRYGGLEASDNPRRSGETLSATAVRPTFFSDSPRCGSRTSNRTSSATTMPGTAEM